MNRQPLLLISRKDLLDATSTEDGDRLVRTLASLTRKGFHFVATASQGGEWSKSKAVSKRSRPGPKRIRDRLAEAGGILDGVYYIPQSLLTQKARREEALKDLLKRFGTPASDCFLVSSNRNFIKSAGDLGINTRKITDKQDLDILLIQLRDEVICD
jgi:hypothetical protein